MLKKGDDVIVLSGHFAGVAGRICRVLRKGKFLITLCGGIHSRSLPMTVVVAPKEVAKAKPRPWR